MKCPPLRDYQLMQSYVDKTGQDIANLKKRLCQARKDLDAEKRKRRVIENRKNLLVHLLTLYKKKKIFFIICILVFNSSFFF